ncbi:MAG: arsenate reductase ArsC [Sulfuricellaceae bacterium]|nr:arsenate reductase ArsC [Sulfuricellaceae bacterium]
MDGKLYKVLFLCTGNSARSIMAEALLNHFGRGKFKAYSAGSHPAGSVHPLTLKELRKSGLSAEGMRSKSWSEFDQPDAAEMDFIITVCDKAAGETCPIWPGRPLTAHWGFEDPVACEGDDEAKRLVFKTVFRHISNRVQLLANLPIEKLDRLKLQSEVRRIGTLGKMNTAELSEEEA